MNPKATHRHRGAVTAAVSVLVTSVSLAGGAQAVTHASAAAPSHSAPTWLKLSSGSGISTVTQPRVARWASKLLVTWQQQEDSGLDDIDTRLLGADARPAGPVAPVVRWYGATTDPEPLMLGGVPTVVFGGLRSDDITDPYDGQLYFAQAADASSWALGNGSLAQSTSAYGDYGFGVVDDGTGQPVTAGAYSSTDQVTVHHGVDTVVPTPDSETDGTGAATGVNLARDTRTGTAWALWYSGVQDDAQQGIRAAQVWPTVGPVLPPAPLSTVPVDGSQHSLDPAQDVSVASRVGGGVWAAYASGWPIAQTIVLWHVGTSTRLTLHTSAGISYTGVSAAPGGRLWVWWVQGQTLYAARTNPSVTRFGVVRSVLTPATDGQAPTRTGGNGALGPLDAVINVIGHDKNASGDPTPEIFSTRILEGLKVTLSRATISAKHGGRLVVTVSDAGVPVPGAVVRVGGRSARTNAQGRATFVIGARTAHGSYTVSATATGFVAGSATYRVS